VACYMGVNIRKVASLHASINVAINPLASNTTGTNNYNLTNIKELRATGQQLKGRSCSYMNK
jgi:hypothetical protein